MTRKIGLLLLASVLLFAVLFAGCGKKDEDGGSDSGTEESLSEDSSGEEDGENPEDGEENMEDGASPEIVQAVQDIMTRAEEDANTATDDSVQTAYNFLVTKCPDYFVDNETMENAIYYGALLENCYRDAGEEEFNQALTDIGTHVKETVQKVYKGEATEKDKDVKSGIKQIKKDIKQYKKIMKDYVKPSDEESSGEEGSSEETSSK